MIIRHSLFLFAILFLIGCERRDEPVVQSLCSHYLDSLKNPDTPENAKRALADRAFNVAAGERKPKWFRAAFDAKFAVVSGQSPDSVLPFVQRYHKIATDNNDTLNLANAQYQLANHYAAIGQAENAFKYYNLSRVKYELLRDSLNVAEKLLLMANIYHQYNDYFGMESATTEALSFINRRVRTAYDSTYVSIAYNNFGLVHTNLGNHDDALKAYETTLRFTSDPVSKGIGRNNRAWAMMEMGNYKGAVTILASLERDSIAMGFLPTKSKVKGNLGYSYFKLGDPRALPLLEESVSIRRQSNDSFGLIAGLVHLSEFHAGSAPNLAEKYALEALEIAKRLQSTDDRISVLQQLRKISSGKVREGYSDQVITLSDSIASARQKARNQFAKYRFDASEAQNENLRLKAEQAQGRLEIETERNGKILLGLTLFATIIIAALSYSLIRRRHRQEKLRESYETETRIAKKVHDELANDVFRAISFAESQDLSLADKKESLLQNLDHVYSRARDISRENSSIDAGDGFRNELQEMLSDYNSDAKNIIVQGLGSVKWEMLSENVKIAIFRVLQELMVNMLKHSNAEVAAVKFSGDGRLVKISYSDNGVGLDPEKFRLNGFANMENRIKTNGGTFSFGSDHGKGLKFEMAFSH